MKFGESDGKIFVGKTAEKVDGYKLSKRTVYKIVKEYIEGKGAQCLYYISEKIIVYRCPMK